SMRRCQENERRPADGLIPVFRVRPASRISLSESGDCILRRRPLAMRSVSCRLATDRHVVVKSFRGVEAKL
ncbi:hypothetical protein BaRGS_00012887, partial [Batillaria attramentaria]